MSHPRASSTVEPDLDTQDQTALLQTLLTTAHHFFGSFTQLFANVADPRRPELITYPPVILLFAGLLLFVCRLGAHSR